MVVLTNKLRAQRQKMGLSQNQLVALLKKSMDISKRTYLRWEYGETEPTIGQWLTMAKAMRCQLYDLYEPAWNESKEEP